MKRRQARRNRGALKSYVDKPLSTKGTQKLLCFSESWTSGSSGGFSSSISISSTLYSCADYSNMASVYQQLKVRRVDITIYPQHFYTNAAVNAYCSNLCIGYSPTESAVPTSADGVLQQALSKVHNSQGVTRFSFRPLVSTGVTKPLPNALFGTSSALLGYFRSYAQNGTYPYTGAIAFVVWQFYTEWHYGQ